MYLRDTDADRGATSATERVCGHVAAARAEGHGRRDARFLDAFGLDVPAGEVVLQHADEAFFGVVARLGAARQARRAMVG